MAYGGVFAVARNDGRIFGEGEELLPDRLHDLPAVATREIGAANAVAEESVTRDDLVLLRNPEADAALRVAGRVNHVEFGFADLERVAFASGRVDLRAFGGAYAEPFGLCIQTVAH